MTNYGDPRLPQRVWRKIRVSDTGCWEWTGARNANTGYGVAPDKSARTHVAHRYVYTYLVGRVPDWNPQSGPELDHLCRNRICCNPDHLELVSRVENLLRSRGITAQAMRARSETGRCLRGHDEWEVRASGVGCRRCRLDKAAEHYQTRERARKALGLSVSEYRDRYGLSKAAAEAVLNDATNTGEP